MRSCKMELLSPAGDRASLVAAVQNGADAVYLGARGFNARRGADNFAGDALREAVEYCHLRGVKVYVTLNTMVRQDELSELERTVNEIYLSGADAFIVQDLGVAEIAARMAPEMELHASTQMAVHNLQGVMRLKEMGFSRAVLAREMTFDEIKKCSGRGIALEVFGHGALCVSCSGQCLMSSLIGGRSGNRGMCAQPCRMKYSMGGKEGYLLSPRDLMTADILESLRAAGADSLKIEGRLKRPEYVAVVTGIYRRAIDGERITEDDVFELRQIFNRGGFTHGYGPGAEETSLMFRQRPNNAGVIAGRAPQNGNVLLERDIDSADALVLRGAGEDIPVKLWGKRGERVNCPEAKKGDGLVRLVSEAQLAGARASWEGERRPAMISGRFILKVGAPMELLVECGAYASRAVGAQVQPAVKRPLDVARVESQLRKTGGTAYVFDKLEIDADENAFAAISEINNLRRDALDGLARAMCPANRAPGRMGEVRALPPAVVEKPLLRAQSGNVRALMDALRQGADELVFAPEDMRALDVALEMERFYIAIPQVMRGEELDGLNRWANANSEKIAGVYAGNIAHLALNWPGRVIADYSMNIANEIAAEQTRCGEFSPSVELTSRQIDALGGKKDIIVHGFLPLMQLRHCPNRAANDIPGKHALCRICDAGCALKPLEDRTGARFGLKRIAYDSGCVVLLMNSVPLMLLRRLSRLPKAHAWRVLIEEDTADAVGLYRTALDGGDYTQLAQWCKYDEMRSTTGHYFRGVE